VHEVLIIGGGPAGLTAGMYCRMRKMSVLIVDAGRIGGQLVSLYGDKPVHDWPGYHHVIASELANTLIEHARELGAETLDQTKVLDLLRRDDGTFELQTLNAVTRESRTIEAQTIIIAIGGGAFEPRKLKVAGEDALEEDQLTYRMAEKARVAGKTVVVIGGGDSGLESAQAAAQAGASVTIVQVLERLTGMEANIDEVDELKIPRMLNTRVKELVVVDGRLTGVVVQTKGAEAPVTVPCDYLVVNIGASVNLDAVKRWGIAVEGNVIPVDNHMKTNIDGVFACGDIVTYEGKYKLLLTASKEGAVAANAAYVHVRKPSRVTMGDLYT
jgi:thioredoxin reductase (NADPH)